MKNGKLLKCFPNSNVDWVSFYKNFKILVLLEKKLFSYWERLHLNYCWI